MSNVVIILDKSADRADIILCLQKATGRNLSDIRTSLLKTLPIVEVELFDGDYDSRAALLRSVLACIDKHSLSSKIYELPEGERMETCRIATICEIDQSFLENLLNAADSDGGGYRVG